MAKEIGQQEETSSERKTTKQRGQRKDPQASDQNLLKSESELGQNLLYVMRGDLGDLRPVFIK